MNSINKGLEAGGKIDLSPLESARALDKTTVALKLKTPDITFIKQPHHPSIFMINST